MTSLNCMLREIESDVPIIYLKLIFSLVVPIVELLIFFLTNQVSNQFRKKKQPISILATATMFVFILVQPDLVLEMIALLSCRQIGDTLYILDNVTYECYTDNYWYYSSIIVIPCLALFAIAIPLFLMRVIFQNRNQLRETNINLKYGFLYREYKHEVYYWEFVKMAEKIGIIIIINFFSQYANVKGVIIFFILTFYGIASNTRQPYREPNYNKIDVYQTNVCAVTVLLCLFINYNPYEYFIIGSIVMILLINIWFIFTLIKRVFLGYMNQFQGTLQKIIERVPFTLKLCFKRKNKKMNFRPELKTKLKRLLFIFANLTNDQKLQLLLSGIKRKLQENEILFNQNQESPGDDPNNWLSKSSIKDSQNQFKSQLALSQIAEEDIYVVLTPTRHISSPFNRAEVKPNLAQVKDLQQIEDNTRGKDEEIKSNEALPLALNYKESQDIELISLN